MLETNPSVQEYKKRILPDNEKLMYKQRISVLQRGDKFPKLPQKVLTFYTFYLLFVRNIKNYAERMSLFMINF